MSAMQSHQANPLTRKLGHFVPLTEDDQRALDELGRPVEQFKAYQDIVAEGQVPRTVFVMLEGMACRYRQLSDGRRQIMTFLLPGDLCDLHAFLLKAMDHSIGTLTPVRLAAIERDAVINMTLRHPRISAALWWASLQEEAMLRERIVALGRREAIERIAYLLCELVWRQQAIGGGAGDRIALPLTQTELADTLGLTPVHINRMLQALRQQKLVTLEHRQLWVLNIERLAEIAQFDSSYLHLGPAPDDIKRYFDSSNSLPRA